MRTSREFEQWTSVAESYRDAGIEMTMFRLTARGIVARHAIPARNIVGHGDIAPDRKSDPGELFDWRRLAHAGIGLWPDPSAGRIERIPAMLRQFGYDTGGAGALAAFQRHFRPARVDGIGDRESARCLAGLMALIG